MVKKNRDKIERYEALCKEIGEHPANVALAWLLSNPVVNRAHNRPANPGSSLQNASIRAQRRNRVSPETLAKLDAIFPGPGGTAPEASAWWLPPDSTHRCR